ncbi:hypothetical protein QWY90_05080 [Flavobacterium paronense]|uniref:Glycosyltransferase WbuB n=1 Tax=Flavobacterium paronense TaxID=1392775 RepID=A0ABV5GAM3_9FLAO|nr:hypothetical protein [Flavobacterium paronense]MDN3676682.1 hypothetical protein [Flavobacterium paronense]
MKETNYKLLLVSVFGRINSASNDRINSLHDYLTLDRKVVTTDFSHRDKEYRATSSHRNVDFLHVLPYKKNFSIARILSHWSFALRLFFYLLKYGKQYNFLYCAIPTPSSSFVCGVYKTFFNKKIIFIVDVIDIWPEGLIPLNKNYAVLSPVLYLWKLLSIYSYKKADIILAATDSYMKQASRFNSKARTICIPLGIDHDNIRSLTALSKIENQKASNELWLCYAGNLGASYDFDAVIEAVSSVLATSGHYKIKFIIIGGGDKEAELKQKLAVTSIDYLITGNIEYSDYLKFLSFCDIGFNVYVENSEVIQSYKFNDYVVSGLYILNSLKGETADLITNYGIGRNLISSNKELYFSLQETIDNWKVLSQTIDINCERLINDVLDKKKIYPKLEQLLLDLVKL